MRAAPFRAAAEWLLFAGAALLPAVVAGALGVRAVANEEAARRREMTAEVARAAARGAERVRADLALGTTALESAPLSDVPGEAPRVTEWFSVASTVTPPSAQAVVVSPAGRVVAPARDAAASHHQPNDAPPNPRCATVTTGLIGARDLPDRKAEIVAHCPEARTDLGRYLWLSFAVEALAGKPTDDALATSIATWIEGHAPNLRPAERADVGREIAAIDGIDATLRARIETALDRGASEDDQLQRAVTADAERGGSATRETTAFQGAGALGSLRSMKNGFALGFVANEDTVRHAISARPEAYGADGATRIEVTTASLPRSDVAATEWITEGLGIRAVARDPSAIVRRTSVSKIVVAATAGAGAFVAVALATVLFLRMRSARRTSALRTSFVAAVSHELRTPIASIRMLSELLEENRVEEGERDEVYGALAREARRLGDTVDRLLGFTRLTAGKMVLEKETVPFARPIERAIAAFRERRPDALVEATLDRAVRAEIDPGQMEHVATNLLENARKHAPSGGPYRVVVAGIDGMAVLSVKDHGPGIPRAHHKRIFDAFERVDDRLSKATEGSGIGLSIVRGIAAAHGGRAWVESTEGNGATFYVSVPALASRIEEETP